MKDLRGANVVVVGMARSGTAAAELLLEKGASVTGVDSRPPAELPEGARKLKIVPQSPAAFHGADLVVLSPGVPLDIAELQGAKAAGIPIIGEVELASYFLRGPVIGITGSNGKTTTTAMVGHILRESGIPCQVGGNIGTPPTAMIASSRPDQWNVLELSSFQLETINEFRAQVAVALNVTPDHLDRHYTLEKYAAAKARLFETQDESGYAILNADDPITVSYASLTRARPLWFSLNNAVSPGLYLWDEQLIFDGEPFLRLKDIPLPGLHNVENTLAASAASRIAGASLAQIASAVRTFPGVEHRIEFVRELNGVKYYNDSKATNVDATQKALDAFSGGLWIILGGKDKNSDYTVLKDSLRQKARGILLIGAAAPKIAEQLGSDLPLIQCQTIDAAVREGHSRAQAGDIVLLAPACASFDQFQSYEHRGSVFKEEVRKL